MPGRSSIKDRCQSLRTPCYRIELTKIIAFNRNEWQILPLPIETDSFLTALKIMKIRSLDPTPCSSLSDQKSQTLSSKHRLSRPIKRKRHLQSPRKTSIRTMLKQIRARSLSNTWPGRVPLQHKRFRKCQIRTFWMSFKSISSLRIRLFPSSRQKNSCKHLAQ